MTFEEWWDSQEQLLQSGEPFDLKEFVKQAWDCAQQRAPLSPADVSEADFKVVGK